MHSLADYDYHLPPEAIAQTPAPRRDGSRLLVLERESGKTQHQVFRHIPDLLDAGDLLVVNDTAVIPARLNGTKETGGKVEVLLLDFVGNGPAEGPSVCRCLVKASKAPKIGSTLRFGADLGATVTDFRDGVFEVRFAHREPLDRILERIGQVPLPPYVKRPDGRPTDADTAAYQTVYARSKGAVAAPTAGLHFTDELLARIRARGVEVAEITLHVGYGTFLPVKVDDIRQHRMHAERYTIGAAAAAAIDRAKASGRRVVAVGTTTVRTLEYAADEKGRVQPGQGSCDLFIYPGYRFRLVDAMVTNFHLPRSTLLMLVSAFAGRQRILAAYAEAVGVGYRFYSYGDAMLIV